jgi:phenylpyruvate tautomerase PptA (4-oxalocrotonate tautomerase family)
MPIAKVYLPAGSLSPEQRRAIVKGIHEVINGVEKRPASAQTYVLINEVATCDWGTAGSVYQPG